MVISESSGFERQTIAEFSFSQTVKYSKQTEIYQWSKVLTSDWPIRLIQFTQFIQFIQFIPCTWDKNLSIAYDWLNDLPFCEACYWCRSVIAQYIFGKPIGGDIWIEWFWMITKCRICLLLLLPPFDIKEYANVTRQPGFSPGICPHIETVWFCMISDYQYFRPYDDVLVNMQRITIYK